MRPFWKYFLKMLLGFIFFGVGLFTYNDLFAHFRQSPIKWLLFFLPMIPMLFVVTTILEYVFTMDEMWRKYITEAAAFAGLATAVTCFSFTRDLGAAVRPEFGYEVFCSYYLIGTVWSRWRMR
jgi:hypothetical protein